MSFQLSVSRETREGRCVGGLEMFVLEGGGGGSAVVVAGFVVSRPAAWRAARASLKYVVFEVCGGGRARVLRMCSSELCAASLVAVLSVVVVIGAVIYPTITRPAISGSESASSSLMVYWI